MGLGNTRRIALGDTLLRASGRMKSRPCLAHELGHHVNRDIPLGIAFQSVVTLLGLFLVHLGLQTGVRVLGFRGVDDVAAFPVFAAVMGAFCVITMPLRNAFSRWRERRPTLRAVRRLANREAFVICHDAPGQPKSL